MLTRAVNGELVNGSVGKVWMFTMAQDESQSLALVGLEQPSGSVILHVVGREISETRECYNSMLWLPNQRPLILVWAVTVHKVQRATLPRAQVDLVGCLDIGQAYVPCSRVPSIDCMRVTEFKGHVVRGNPVAVKYYSELE